MSNLALPVNMEALVSRFLREQEEIEALIPHLDDVARVYTALPKGVEFPAVRVTQIDDEPLTHQPLWLSRYVIQVEAWGGTKAQAWKLSALCKATIAARIDGVHSEGVVNGVQFSGSLDLPDEDFEKARPRWIFSATITAHPLSTSVAS